MIAKEKSRKKGKKVKEAWRVKDHYITNYCLKWNIKQTQKYLMMIISVVHSEEHMSLNLHHTLCNDLNMNNTSRLNTVLNLC